MHARNRQTPVTSPERGFTMAELLISLFVMMVVLLAALAMFDASNKITRAQTHVSDMQQSLRIAQHQMIRHSRMAGRGGLQVGNLPAGNAVAVTNNVPAGTAIDGGGGPPVVEGTDILTVRGVFNTPLYQVNPAPASFTVDAGFTTGTVRIVNPTDTGVPQSLQDIIDAVDEDRPEALLVMSPLGGILHAVVELDPAGSNVANSNDVTIAFFITNGGGGTHADSYAALYPGDDNNFPSELRSVSHVGILEEYRYYVREQYAVDGDATSLERHLLSQARMYPGTSTPHAGEAANLRLDIAENILDLQVALGVDTDGDFDLVENNPPDDADEWMYNAAGDPVLVGDLYYLRINTLARTDRRDLKYVSPPIDAIEDRDYLEPAEPGSSAEIVDRAHRRRALRSIVEMRNV